MDRERAIVRTSVLGIIANVIIAVVKVIIGLAVSSIAIITEGVNNATDAISSVITILGTKLSKKKPDAKHPFGYGRIEFLTSLIIACIILVSGVELLKESVKLIIEPAEISISYMTLVIIGVSGLIKFFLGIYTIKVGKRVDSGALVGVGTECRNDAFVSIITIVSAVLFVLFGISADAYAGVITSLIVLKAGVEVLLETVSELLGRPGKKELATQLYKEIRSTEGVINAADMMLHNYGPESYSGSVNIEIDHSRTVGDVYSVIHDLQLRIMHKYNVTMVFGIYAVDNDSVSSKKLRSEIASFVRNTEHIVSYHAVYLSEKESRIYCDFTVDYDLKDWDDLKKKFEDYIKGFYPDKSVELTIETDFV